MLKNNGTVENITVVFDRSYLFPCPKGSKHIRRSKGRLGRKVVASLHTPLTVKKGDFLLHKHNKQVFLECLGFNALLDQLGLSKCICLISFKIPIMFLMRGGGGEVIVAKTSWTVASTFDEIYQSFKNYLLNNYGTVENITIVFDRGYLVPCPKGSKHIRRSKGRLGRKVVRSLHNPLTVKKADILLHKHNKQAFLECWDSISSFRY